MKAVSMDIDRIRSIMLIIDFTDDLLQHILDGNQAGNAADPFKISKRSLSI